MKTDDNTRRVFRSTIKSVEDWLGIELTDEQWRQAARTLGVGNGGAGAPGAQADVVPAHRGRESFDIAAGRLVHLHDPLSPATEPEQVLQCAPDEIAPRLTRARAITAMVALTAMRADYFGGGADELIRAASEQAGELLDQAIYWDAAVRAALALQREAA